MTPASIIGQDDVVASFRQCLARGRLASSYLFVGPAGVGKRTFALRLAQSLLCERGLVHELEPCWQCESCLQVQAGTHPDIELIGLPKDKKTIPVELLIGDRDHRGQEGFCHRMAIKAFMGGYKVGIIDDADHFKEEGANSLLKTLEEPPPRSLIILLGTSPDRQLPTIRSRCQIVRFRPLDAEVIAGLLVQQGVADDTQMADQLARHSDGGLERAKELADEPFWIFRQHFLKGLARSPLDAVRMAKAVTSFVDEGGPDSSTKRRRATRAVETALEFYGGVLRDLCGAANGLRDREDADLRAAIDAWLSQHGGTAEQVSGCVRRCLAAIRHIDRNANIATAMECWCDDLAGMCGE